MLSFNTTIEGHGESKIETSKTESALQAGKLNTDDGEYGKRRLNLKFKAVLKYLSSQCGIKDYEGERNRER